MVQYIALTVLLILFPSSCVYGSSCSNPSPQELFDNSDFVFIGKLSKSTTLSDNSSTKNFIIRYSWKGTNASEISIETKAEFLPGNHYLVYASIADVPSEKHFSVYSVEGLQSELQTKPVFTLSWGQCNPVNLIPSRDVHGYLAHLAAFPMKINKDNEKSTVQKTIALKHRQQEVNFWYQKGKTALRYYLSNEGIEGPFTQKYPNGKIAMEGNVLSGRRTGRWRYFSRNGTLFLTAEYSSGLLHGSLISFLPTGEKKFRKSLC